MKNQTLIIGGAIAVGVAAYFYYTKSKPKTDDGADTNTASTDKSDKSSEPTQTNAPSKGKSSSMAQKGLEVSQTQSKTASSQSKAQRDDAKMEEGINEWKYQPLAGMIPQNQEDMRIKHKAHSQFLKDWAKKNNVDFAAYKERRRRAAIDKNLQETQTETAAFAFNGHSF